MEENHLSKNNYSGNIMNNLYNGEGILITCNIQPIAMSNQVVL